ncbi:NAD(P)-binding domain-containing protein [Asanoa sp. WMMD1127]|uniref:NADPH-dependent F420 reductase n=1 Tax=Asanoa sp. WMMD1127 TaxID=3016107 RepID=UPI0024170BC3|nr:NAD(P)-binding domain-containing protein [Asanoa sp. WMMD1127]MDG4822096.1 NAD(P)-binding domain-containing protein [Asanoa sp. WMMD1127]
MRIGILGTGTVGQTFGTRLRNLDHEVVLGARESGNPRAVEWAEAHAARCGTFAEAVADADLVINATAGQYAVDALEMAGGNPALAGKVVLDLSNPLDFSSGDLRLSVCNTDSVGEQIQRAFPDARIVKSLNTVNGSVMVEPSLVPGQHTIFVAGNDPEAKQVVIGLLGELGWVRANVLDLGGIEASRGMEMYMPLWVSILRALDGNLAFNINVVQG